MRVLSTAWIEGLGFRVHYGDSPQNLAPGFSPTSVFLPASVG